MSVGSSRRAADRAHLGALAGALGAAHADRGRGHAVRADRPPAVRAAHAGLAVRMPVTVSIARRRASWRRAYRSTRIIGLSPGTRAPPRRSRVTSTASAPLRSSGSATDPLPSRSATKVGAGDDPVAALRSTPGRRARAEVGQALGGERRAVVAVALHAQLRARRRKPWIVHLGGDRALVLAARRAGPRRSRRGAPATSIAPASAGRIGAIRGSRSRRLRRARPAPPRRRPRRDGVHDRRAEPVRRRPPARRSAAAHRPPAAGARPRRGSRGTTPCGARTPALLVGERAEQEGAGVVREALVVGPGHASSPGVKLSASCARIFSRPSRMRPLTVPIGIAEHLGDLAVAEAAEVGQLDRAALLVRQLLQRAADAARLLAARRLHVRALAAPRSAPRCLRASRACARGRCRAGAASIARLWTMPSTQVRTLPRAWS